MAEHIQSILVRLGVGGLGGLGLSGFAVLAVFWVGDPVDMQTLSASCGSVNLITQPHLDPQFHPPKHTPQTHLQPPPLTHPQQAEVDKDNDGRIDYEEFCAMMRAGNDEGERALRTGLIAKPQSMK